MINTTLTLCKGVPTSGKKYADRLKDNYVKWKSCGPEFAGCASKISGHDDVRTSIEVPEDVHVKTSLTFNRSNTRVKRDYNSSNLDLSPSDLNLLSRIIKGIHQRIFIKLVIELRIFLKLTITYCLFLD